MSESNNGSFRQVATDVMDLVELQMQLFAIDSQVAKQKVTTAIACAIVAVTLAGSALTTLMVGGGFLLHELADWTVGVSLLTVAIAIFVISGILLFVAIKAIKKASSAMNESKSEFAENVKWLKATLISPGTSPRNQVRSEDFPFADRPFAQEPS